jgi:hypothetical protein
MNIHDKINIKDKAYIYLEWNQYMQLINNNKIALTPYYYERLRRQGNYVAECENFKSIFGKSRYEYDNNITT